MATATDNSTVLQDRDNFLFNLLHKEFAFIFDKEFYKKNNIKADDLKDFFIKHKAAEKIAHDFSLATSAQFLDYLLEDILSLQIINHNNDKHTFQSIFNERNRIIASGKESIDFYCDQFKNTILNKENLKERQFTSDEIRKMDYKELLEKAPRSIEIRLRLIEKINAITDEKERWGKRDEIAQKIIHEMPPTPAQIANTISILKEKYTKDDIIVEEDDIHVITCIPEGLDNKVVLYFNDKWYIAISNLIQNFYHKRETFKESDLFNKWSNCAISNKIVTEILHWSLDPTKGKFKSSTERSIQCVG